MNVVIIIVGENKVKQIEKSKRHPVFFKPELFKWCLKHYSDAEDKEYADALYKHVVKHMSYGIGDIIGNDLDVADYDRWYNVNKVFDCEFTYEQASNLTHILYEHDIETLEMTGIAYGSGFLNDEYKEEMDEHMKMVNKRSAESMKKMAMYDY